MPDQIDRWLDEYNLTDEERRFARAVGRPDRFDLWRIDQSTLAVACDIVPPGARSIILTIGVHHSPGRVVGDVLDGQGFDLPALGTTLRFEATGTTDVLAAATVAWFDDVLGTRLHVDEWVHRGRVYAAVWWVEGFRDVQSAYDLEAAPWRVRRRVKRAGGRIRPRTIGAPDGTRRLQLP